MALKNAKVQPMLTFIIQSIISRVIDFNNFELMASTDLSVAINLVNTNLFIKHLKIIGFSLDVLNSSISGHLRGPFM
jgi:hypothetical protein